ncbi:MAG: hypothetical protein ABSC38_00095 [Verrucomicrobiia bacterium]
MNQTMSVSSGSGFKDRRGGLICFGIIMIVIGCVCALFVPLMFLGQMMSTKATGGAPNYSMMAPAALIYALLAVAFVWLGIGSIMARRWARALLLILAWIWLVTGIFMIGFMAFFLPSVFANQPSGGHQLPETTLVVVMIVALGFISVIFLVLPGMLVLFYRSPHVKATCEARDPVVRWTDACPLPVLALSLLLGFSAVSMLPMLVVYHSVMPFFGRLLTGAPGTLLILVMIALWGYCAWAAYRLKSAGWWIILIGVGVMMASSLITFARVDPIEMYRLMGYPEQQIAQIEQYSFFKGGNLFLLMLICPLPLFGYLLWVKKYFRPPATSNP